jgi:hypothetical protein
MNNRLGLVFTWALILIASPTTIILWRTLATHEPYWWPWLHGLILLSLLSITLIHPILKALRRFAAIITIIYFMGFGGGWNWGLIPFIRSNEIWISWMNTAPIALQEIALHSLRLTPALLILLFLLATKRKRADFFLTKGDIHASVGRSRLLRIKKHEPWIKVASIFAAIFVFGTILFLFGSSEIRWNLLITNWSLIPVAILVALINGFNEEFSLRAAPLGELEPFIGRPDSLLITTAYFGLGHYYGVPSGVIGVILSGFLGWLLGKSMLETRGFLLAWVVHFITDIPIFLFLITGAI